MKLVPVEGNPFEQQTKPEPKLVPVDFNPFEQQPTEVEASDLPEFATVDGNEALFGSQFGDEKNGFGAVLRDAGAALVTFNPKARIDGIRKRFPDLEVEEFGENNAIIRNPENGGVTVLNSEGLSMADISPFLSAAIPGLGGAKAIQAAKGVSGKFAVGAATGAATDAAFQGAEIAQGSEQGFDKARLGVSAATGGALPVAGDKIAKVANNASVRKAFSKAAPTIEAVKNRASQIYQEIDDAGVILSQGFTEKLNKSLSNLAKKRAFTPEIHKDTAAALKAFEKREGQQIKFSELDNLRQIMGEAAQSTDKRDKRIASAMIEKIDEAFQSMSPKSAVSGNTDGIAEKIAEARKLWRQTKKAEIIEDAIRKGSEAASGPETGIINAFRAIRKSDKLRKNFSEDELKELALVVRGDLGSNILKFAGKFGIEDGGAVRAMMPLLGITVGTAAGGGAGGLAVAAGGQAARKLSSRLTEKRSQFAQQVAAAGEDGLKLTQAYLQNTPRSKRSAEELAQLLLTKNINPSQLERLAKGRPSERKTLVKDAQILLKGLAAGGAVTGSRQLAAEEVTQ